MQNPNQMSISVDRHRKNSYNPEKQKFSDYLGFLHERSNLLAIINVSSEICKAKSVYFYECDIQI